MCRFRGGTPHWTERNACVIMIGEWKGGKSMRYRAQGKSALETRVDYVESRLDETIKDFKEAIRDNKEAMKQLDLNQRDNQKELKNSLRWLIGTCTVIIGLMLTAFSIIINLLL